ncbi:GMC oxidoreductase-domain-containing protein [Mycena galopus ATCC 62051]|nr:GMC oxidoreductase-domain-containing protein [Mycena galopus ATCC 62051]
MDQYDIIFGGGGSTACVIAGRLAAVDSSLRILVVENGRLTKDNPLHVQPGRFLENITITTPRTEAITLHSSVPGVNLGGRAAVAANASCVGGGSGINAMMYNRAPASDYDNWKQLGNPGWGSADLIPLARKLETYQVGAVDSAHGSAGPIKVSHGGYDTKVGKDFLAAAAGFPRGRKFADDLNDFFTCDVYGSIPKYIDAETGRRSDTAHCYVYNQAHNENLRIVDRARVNRVLFEDDNRATGIEYQVGGRDGAMQTAHASRLVVISAGSFCSPAILERRQGDLGEIAIAVVSDLPGVGQNYTDHHVAVPRYLGPEDMVMVGVKDQDQDGVLEAQWLHGKAHAGSLFSRTPQKNVWHWFGLLLSNDFSRLFVNNLEKASYTSYSVAYLAAYPIATGYVHIKSANPFVPLDEIRPRQFKHRPSQRKFRLISINL